MLLAVSLLACAGALVVVAAQPAWPADGRPLRLPQMPPHDPFVLADEAARPWMVYAHEWVQRGDGTMEAVPLRPDLSGAAGPPVHLFKASNAPWLNASITPAPGRLDYVTDGPQLFRTHSG